MLAVVAASVMALPVRGSVPYLRSVGPVPLRLAMVHPAGLPPGWKPLKYVLWPELDPANAHRATNGVASKEVAVKPAPTVIYTNIPNPAPVVLSAGPVDQTNAAPAPVIIMPVRSNGDVDPVSSQTLSDYFRPAPGSNAGGPGRVDERKFGFTPPAPKSSPPSEATYGN